MKAIKQNIRVALVEPDPLIRDLLCDSLRRAEGFECSAVFSTGEEAIQRVGQALLNLVLMEVNLPGEAGIQCLRQIRKALPEIPVIILTSTEQDDAVFGALKAGAQGYILKSCSPQYILDSIMEVVQGGASFSPSVARKLTDYFQQQGRKMDGMHRLSIREKEVLELLSKGLMLKEIGQRLGIKFETVRDHVRNLYTKMGVRSRTEAAVTFLSHTL